MMTSIHHLPVEILFNVLVRLPVEDLIRCIGVCKSWWCLITHPNFISANLSFHKNCNGYLLHHKMGPSGRNLFSKLHMNTCVEHSCYEAPFSCETDFFQLVASSNGLICLSDLHHFFGKTIYLWNPCIWRLKVLRHSCFARHFRDGKFFFAIGVGFGQQGNDLKIVRIMYSGNFHLPIYVENQPPKVEVYSLATNSWRRVGTNAGYYTIDKLSTAYVNGAVHWVASKTGEGYRFRKFVLSFHFDSANFGEIMLPNYHHDGDGDSRRVSVAVLKDSLVLIVSCLNNYKIERCYIWVMREYGVAESWTKEYSIVPDERFSRTFGIINNHLLFESTVNGAELVSYDLENLQFKHLGIGRHYNHDLVTFSESLVLYHEGIPLTPRKYLIIEGGIHLGKRKWSVFLQLQKKWR
ncbi:F-box protein [Melia azedarach]|uniref:F-box protein n=2 Tax=Melia azedarach TaxID=155640 RepID=A0ACC1X8E2_MELAZ|nr:F-box protein [Melia azedarach]KAJ4706954.1 F-box protein [Melia azedarach]